MWTLKVYARLRKIDQDDSLIIYLLLFPPRAVAGVMLSSVKQRHEEEAFASLQPSFASLKMAATIPKTEQKKKTQKVSLKYT